ncbi:hypothetical protein [Blastopirellula retiformator]|uniref:hypothetical protein n=1 Tax=Blastopirellula retiformator TaxID=2527970 RepID=UPI0011B36968|nr:hypothetical protein [Blastopirellula retiformator]
MSPRLSLFLPRELAHDPIPLSLLRATCGADIGGKQWHELIQTLDQGDFPQTRLLRQLKQQGFTGPVTLQCYGVQGGRKQNLERSINALRKTIAAVSPS